MEETYLHPITEEKITFRPATTSESISAAAYGFENIAKPLIFDLLWLQLGEIVRTKDGVFTNTSITDDSELKNLLNGAEKVNGIYLLDNGIGFAPYSSFKIGEQDCDAFAQGGLARVLEHTPEKAAVKLREIASPKHYKKGVYVFGFDSVREPVQEVAGLSSDKYGSSNERLFVTWGYGSYACAFGVKK